MAAVTQKGLTTMDVAITAQNLEITDVTKIVVTEIQQDTVTGMYTRDIRILGGPGSVTDASAPLVVQLRVRALHRENLEMVAPEQLY
jgi:hypothetical protein